MRRVVVVGRGKVGSTLARAARKARLTVVLVSARSIMAAATLSKSDLVVVATRDPDIAAVAKALAASARLPVAAVHCAGALGPEVLAPLAARGVATGAAHPLLSFASVERAPSLVGGALVIEGHPQAVRLAKELGRRLEMVPVVVSGIDRARYHAAAALMANGSAALAALAAAVLGSAGIDAARAGALLGPLLATVASNVRQLGPDRALTGPVRRGDAETIRRHLEALDAALPEASAMYRMLVQAQLPLARALAASEGTSASTEAAFQVIERLVDQS